MSYIIFADMNRLVAGNINIFVVTLRQHLNIVKCIIQQLRISATISALHDVILYRQTGPIPVYNTCTLL